MDNTYMQKTFFCFLWKKQTSQGRLFSQLKNTLPYSMVGKSRGGDSSFFVINMSKSNLSSLCFRSN